MKVVHVLKRIETIDHDIKDLKKLEKSIASNKSFSTPIYMSIEQQINLLLAERVKLFELQISNPPKSFIEKAGEDEEEFKPLLNTSSSKKSTKKNKKRVVAVKKSQTVVVDASDADDDLPMQMLTQDQIDLKITSLKGESSDSGVTSEKPGLGLDKQTLEDDSVKLLDIALDKGSAEKKNVVKEKKRVRFFKDNFPGGQY